MAEKAEKLLNASNWTKQHDEFCLKNSLKPSARLIWEWMLTTKNNTVEPDLKDFNRWIKRHRGKSYHRDTIKRSWQQLIDVGVIEPKKKYSWNVWRIVLKPISDFIRSRKRSQPRKKNRGSSPGNLINGAKRFIAAAANIEEVKEILSLCRESGIEFFETHNLLKFSLEEVVRSLGLFWQRGGHEKIGNPCGWLLECLRRKWYEDNSKFESRKSELNFEFRISNSDFDYYSPGNGRPLAFQDLEALGT